MHGAAQGVLRQKYVVCTIRRDEERIAFARTLHAPVYAPQQRGHRPPALAVFHCAAGLAQLFQGAGQNRPVHFTQPAQRRRVQGCLLLFQRRKRLRGLRRNCLIQSNVSS